MEDLGSNDVNVYVMVPVFHMPGNKDNPHSMLPKKRIMLLETIALLFLVSRSDVSQPHGLIFEANEHTNGWWRVILSDFNIEQLTSIVDET